MTQGWGEPRPNRDGVHEGLDFPLPIGTSIFSIGDGTVVTSADTDDAGGAGKMISVQHSNGIVSRYMHLDARLVQKGAKVFAGQRIAQSGNTGIKRSGPHLHFDLKVKPDKLSEYTSRFGTPVGGFPAQRFGFIGIPAEPFIPVDKYAPLVQRHAAQNNIPLYTAGAGILGYAIILGGLYFIVKG